MEGKESNEECDDVDAVMRLEGFLTEPYSPLDEAMKLLELLIEDFSEEEFTIDDIEDEINSSSLFKCMCLTTNEAENEIKTECSDEQCGPTRSHQIKAFKLRHIEILMSKELIDAKTIQGVGEEMDTNVFKLTEKALSRYYQGVDSLVSQKSDEARAYTNKIRGMAQAM